MWEILQMCNFMLLGINLKLNIIYHKSIIIYIKSINISSCETNQVWNGLSSDCCCLTLFFLLSELGYLKSNLCFVTKSPNGQNNLKSKGILLLNLEAKHDYDTTKSAKKWNINDTRPPNC